MALQTQTHNGSAADAPTPTPPPPPNWGETSSQNTTNAFSPAGSPPLILAFLAIGLFSAAMIIVFGWRRMQFGRFVIGGPPPLQFNGAASKTPFVLPQKPKLWEMWDSDEITWKQVSGSSEKRAAVYDGQWTNMMPLSANEVSADVPNADDTTTQIPEPSSSTSPSPHTDRRFTSIRQALNDRHGWPRSARRGSINREPAAEKDAYELQSPRSSTTPSKTLQVGVAIILPCAQYPIYVRERTQLNEHPDERMPRRRKEPPDYSIGLYDCSWE